MLVACPGPIPAGPAGPSHTGTCPRPWHTPLRWPGSRASGTPAQTSQGGFINLAVAPAGGTWRHACNLPISTQTGRDWLGKRRATATWRAKGRTSLNWMMWGCSRPLWFSISLCTYTLESFSPRCMNLMATCRGAQQSLARCWAATSRWQPQPLDALVHVCEQFNSASRPRWLSCHGRAAQSHSCPCSGPSTLCIWGGPPEARWPAAGTPSPLLGLTLLLPDVVLRPKPEGRVLYVTPKPAVPVLAAVQAPSLWDVKLLNVKTL